MKENQQIEFKQSWRDEYLQYLCGFANAQGGTLYIGIDDNGTICGIANARKLLENLPNQINQTMGLLAQVDLLSKDDKEYISIRVEAANQAISYKGKFYYRSGSTLQEMNGVALQQFLINKNGLSYELLPNPTATIEDIDRDTVEYFLYCAGKAGRITGDAGNSSTETILQHLNLLTRDNQLTNAAVLLFGKNPQQFYPTSHFRLGRFGKRPSDLLFQDQVEGNIFQMTNRVIQLLRSKYLKTPIHYEGMQRVEELEIPETALRELLYNAMIHRDYMGDETQMKVYDDHIWLWNAGELPQGYNTESLQREHRSILRNKTIASIFFQAGFIEHWGRGFDKVQAAFETNNIPFPQVENQFGGTSIYIQRETETQEDPEKSTLKSTLKSTEKTTESIAENIVESIVENLSAMRGRIVKIIWKNPKATAQSISKEVGIAPRNVQEHLKYLQKTGILRRIGPDKGGRWEVIE